MIWGKISGDFFIVSTASLHQKWNRIRFWLGETEFNISSKSCRTTNNFRRTLEIGKFQENFWNVCNQRQVGCWLFLMKIWAVAPENYRKKSLARKIIFFTWFHVFSYCILSIREHSKQQWHFNRSFDRSKIFSSILPYAVTYWILSTFISLLSVHQFWFLSELRDWRIFFLFLIRLMFSKTCLFTKSK